MRTAVIFLAVFGVVLSTPDNAIDGTKISEKTHQVHARDTHQNGEITTDTVKFCDLDADCEQKAITEQLQLGEDPIDNNSGNLTEKFLLAVVVKRIRRQAHLSQGWAEHLNKALYPCLLTDEEEYEDTSKHFVDACVDTLIAKYQADLESGFRGRSVASVACSAAEDLYEECLKPEISSCKMKLYIPKLLAVLMILLIVFFDKLIVLVPYKYCKKKFNRVINMVKKIFKYLFFGIALLIVADCLY